MTRDWCDFDKFANYSSFATTVRSFISPPPTHSVEVPSRFGPPWSPRTLNWPKVVLKSEWEELFRLLERIDFHSQKRCGVDNPKNAVTLEWI